MKYNELTLGQIEAIVNKIGGMDEVSRFLAGKLMVVDVPVITTTHHIIVDYTKSLADMVKAGKYFCVSEDYSKLHFPKSTNEETELDVTLIHFNEELRSSNHAVEELAKIGYRPATIEELLSFGATYPDIQRQFPIVALGSAGRRAGDGARQAVCLGGYRSSYGSFERDLDTGNWEHRFSARYRFLAVRK